MSQRSSFTHLLVNGLKILLLTVVMFVLFSTVYTIVGVANDPALAADAGTPTDQARTAMILVGVCFLQTVALSLAILRSRWSGWWLVLAMFTVMALGTAVLPHIDTLFFLQDLSFGLVAKLALASTLLAAAFSPIAVWVLGRAHSGASEDVSSELEHRPMRQWTLIVLGLTILHIVLYFGFGYYVAWKSPELRAFYEGEDPGSFYLQMVSVVKGTPMLIPIQVLRGALWGLVAIILAKSLTGSRWSAALMTASFLVTVFALPLLLPNPLMPDSVRYVHLIETVLSRGLYGFLAVWFLRTPLGMGIAHPKLV